MADVKITALPPAPAVTLDDLVAIVNDPAGAPVTQRAALNQIIYFTKVLTAYIGGDMTGNARGAGSLDIQSARLAVTDVASGAGSLSVGNTCKSSGAYSAAVGAGVAATGYGAFGFGSGVQSYGINSTAVGVYATATGYRSSGFGYNPKARIDYTTSIGGALINRKDNGESSAKVLQNFCGAEVVLLTKEISLKTVADTTITLPTGCHFYANEVGVLITSANTVTVQPTIRFGFTGTPAGLVAATATTGLTANFDRQRFTTLLTAAGLTSILGGVTIAATATTMLGRFYFQGLLVEDE